MLDAEQLDAFGRDGQLTVPDLFSAEESNRALADLQATIANPDKARDYLPKTLMIAGLQMAASIE